MNRVSLRISAIATVAALSALAFSTTGAGTAAAQTFGKDGTIHACYKAKGKNRGTLRVVGGPRGCKKLRGWRPLGWSAAGSSSTAGAQGTPGAGGSSGAEGEAGPAGEPGPQGLAGKVEQSLLETIDDQNTQIQTLTQQVTDLGGEVTDLSNSLTDLGTDVSSLEGTVESACVQLTTLTDQTDALLTAVAGISLNSILKNLGGLLEIDGLPDALGTFECT